MASNVLYKITITETLLNPTDNDSFLTGGLPHIIPH